MEKTITITEEEFRRLASQTTADIMAKYSDHAPQGALLFSLSCVAFSTALAHKLFPDDGNDKTTQTEPSIGQMREQLADFCRKRTCEGCPMDKDCECGRGKFFTIPEDSPGYMTNESIVKHYMTMKGAES